MNESADKIRPASQHAAINRYLREEGHRLRAELHDKASTQVEEIWHDARAKVDERLKAGRTDFSGLKREIRSSIVGRAKTETEATVLKKTWEIVDAVITRCGERLREAAASETFAPIMETLISEAIQSARKIAPQESGIGSCIVLTAPEHAELCRTIIKKLGLDMRVEEDASVWGGIELVVTGTPYRIRNSLPSRMEKLESRMRGRAAQRLRSAISGDMTE